MDKQLQVLDDKLAKVLPIIISELGVETAR